MEYKGAFLDKVFYFFFCMNHKSFRRIGGVCKKFQKMCQVLVKIPLLFVILLSNIRVPDK